MSADEPLPPHCPPPHPKRDPKRQGPPSCTPQSQGILPEEADLRPPIMLFGEGEPKGTTTHSQRLIVGGRNTLSNEAGTGESVAPITQVAQTIK